MGFFDFFFGKKTEKVEPKPQHTQSSNLQGLASSPTKPIPSVKSISQGALFEFDFKTVVVLKQYYNQSSEEIRLSTKITAHMKRSSQSGNVSIIFSDLRELQQRRILQTNLDLCPHFAYNIDGEGNEFASAEINNSFAAVNSGKEYVSLFQITKQKGNIVSFVINNLPGDQDFYYLIIMRDVDNQS